VSGVTKDAGPASCAVVASQWAGGAVRENEVLFSVFSVMQLTGVVYKARTYKYVTAYMVAGRHKKEFLPLLLVFASSQRSKMGEFFSFFAFIIVSIPYFVLILCLPCYI
jgi:hypothetical protein